MRKHFLLRYYASYALGATNWFPTYGTPGGFLYRPYYGGGNFHYIEVLNCLQKNLVKYYTSLILLILQ